MKHKSPESLVSEAWQLVEQLEIERVKAGWGKGQGAWERKTRLDWLCYLARERWARRWKAYYQAAQEQEAQRGSSSK